MNLHEYDLRSAVGSDEKIRNKLSEIDTDLDGAGPNTRREAVSTLRGVFETLGVEIDPRDVIPIYRDSGSSDLLSDVYDTVEEHLPGFDVEAVGATLCVVLADRVFGREGESVWLLLIAPPSSGKTFILVPLGRSHWCTRPLDKITPRTFLSGQRGNEDPSFLSRVDPDSDEDLLFIVKELGQLLSGPADDRSAVFSQLRAIYDGHIVQAYGSGVTRQWGPDGNATFIVAMTHAIDEKQIWNSELGERFLKLRFQGDIKDPTEQAQDAWDSMDAEARAKEALLDAYERALDGGKRRLESGSVSLAENTTGTVIKNLAPLLARVRASVGGDAAPVWERPHRITKQFRLVARAQAALQGQSDLSDYGLLYRLTLDGMPEPRRSLFILTAIAEARHGNVQTGRDRLRAAVGKNKLYRTLPDLQELHLLREVGEDIDTGGRPATVYRFGARVKQFMHESGLWEWLTEETDWRRLLPESVREGVEKK